MGNPEDRFCRVAAHMRQGARKRAYTICDELRDRCHRSSKLLSNFSHNCYAKGFNVLLVFVAGRADISDVSNILFEQIGKARKCNPRSECS